MSKCNVLTIGIVLRRSAGVLLGRIHCQSGSDCCRRFRFGCLGPARSPRSLKRFIPNRSSGLGEIARLCHAACFPSAEGVAGNRMRTEAGKIPESLMFPIRNGLGVSNDRFGFIPYLRSLHVPVLAFLTGDALAGIPVWGRAFGAFPENNRARQGRIPWRFSRSGWSKGNVPDCIARCGKRRNKEMRQRNVIWAIVIILAKVLRKIIQKR